MNAPPAPRAGSSFGSSARTARDTSTVFAAGSFVTEIVSAGRPLTSETVVTGSWFDTTVATSPIVGMCVEVLSGPLYWAAVTPVRGSAAMSAVDPSSVPTWIDRVDPPCCTDPAGTSTPLDFRVLSITSGVRWCFASTSFGVTVMRSPGAPESVAARTPATFSSSGVTDAVASAARESVGASPLTAIASTGRSARLPEMTCGSTPSGSVERILLIAAPIFCSA